ncbi:MAG: acyl carrier protein [Anaerolineaceae bacterium]|nr:acyl carrier protein [Anaerolineaceae bacterium]
MSDDIQAKLAGYIAKDILRQPNRVIEPDQALLSSGLVNSFSLVDLAMFIEDTFNVRIDDFELNKDTFDTLAQLADLIRSRQ